MNNNFSKFIVYGLILLGIIGLISTLATNPEEIFKIALGAIASVALIYLLFKYFFMKSDNKNKDSARYNKAVKQSKKLHTEDKKKKEAKPAIKRAQTKQANGFTVIDGKKKKKDKLFF